MKSTTKYGVVTLILMVLISLYLFFNHEGAKEIVAKDTSTLQQGSAKKDEIGNGKEIEASTVSLKESGQSDLSADEEDSLETDEKYTKAIAKKKGGTAAAEEMQAVQSQFLVVIDPGHQNRANTDPEPIGPGAKEAKIKVTGGTSGVATGKPEYKLTLEASLILGQLLESKGIKVIYTRTTNDVNISNRERAEVANQNAADLFVRIHADGSTDRNVHGLSVLTPANNSPYTKTIFNDSLKASQFIIDETRKNSSIKVNGLSYRGDMSGFNWSKVPSTLVELGFMTNPTEDKNLSDPLYLKNLLTNIADGILDYASYK
ncbi:N-acetylmuramoyl-L-alanine amidase [Neobacillus cucumis]|uniref:N-acetylmuramoyl-L-alanine amidase family protein n=1 Tax=Neobacillus cucumis TaxID=1740721 RepID=UPI002040494A|nr:N-acetylmuramoyl-L-alanine amidase [Neobacillus cucumis]MCM3729127.1 N-acetylmuramoyl-L-alanine amidase [Neobacillus cucumis]